LSAEDAEGRIEREWPQQYRSGDIRQCYADTNLAQRALGFEAQMPLAKGMEDLLEWLEGQEAVDRVDAATRELAARGLTR
jgi:dTDP-L-rhamnose 4-epimerase